MKQEIRDLIEISRFYGKQADYTLAGGGNTSYKNDKTIWIKASGAALATIDEEGFAVLDRKKVRGISKRTYSQDPDERELQVKDDLMDSLLEPEKKKRPSVETSLHEIIDYPFVVHLHPTLTNAMLCAKDSRSVTNELFPENALYIPYTDPGYTLFKKIESQLTGYRKKNEKDPAYLFLENHGVFVGAHSIEEIKTLYSQLSGKIQERCTRLPDPAPLKPDGSITAILPVIRELCSEDHPVSLQFLNNKLISYFAASDTNFKKIHKPFTPDQIVYCKSHYLYVNWPLTEPEGRRKLAKVIRDFQVGQGHYPKIILIQNLGLVSVEENPAAARTTLEVYEDLMKIAYLTGSFGGPRFLTDKQIAFIDHWEVENYRRKIAKEGASRGKVNQKVAIVTGSAQGVGEGIARSLFDEGTNVVIADINRKQGLNLAGELNALQKKNRAIFLQCDVTREASVIELVRETVASFGGLDIYISNAGILYAGGLDEMDPETFRKVTEVNYQGFFLGAKYASEVMKAQHSWSGKRYYDIIQVNSKSGLAGSKKNFAYAGSKFGGIGLTQSFAMELIEHRIKVNAICPGNYFEGPLWSDPDTGLFVQYLKTGKVKGAKTIEDVKRHYEELIPMKRGCYIEDIMKAIYYIIDQEYETGQALPVTGGQIMLK